MKVLSTIQSGLGSIVLVGGLLSCTTNTNSPDTEIPKQKAGPKKGVTGILVDQKKQPVSKSMVQAILGGNEAKKTSGGIFPKTSGAGKPWTDSVVTDSLGRYVFDSLAAGEYNLQGSYEGGSLVVLIPKVRFAGGDALVEVPTDTLRPPGKITGRVLLQDEDNGGVLCYVPGTSYLAVTDDSGDFVLTSIPQGTYALAYRKEGWKPAKDSLIAVESGKNTQLPIRKMEADPAFPPPSPRDLRITYDTVTGIAALRWSPVAVSDLAGYVVFRNPGTGTVPERISPELLADSAFSDSLFRNRFDRTASDWVYRVKAQDQDANLSLSYSKAVSLTAPSPTRVRTTVEWTVRGITGDSGTVGDSITLIADFRNPTRKVAKVSWYVDESIVPIRSQAPEVLQGRDSLRFTSDRVATRTVWVEVLDEGGAVWRHAYPVRFGQDVAIATPPASFFHSTLAISLSTPTADAKIHYTLDGSNPSPTSTLYDPAKPIVLTGTTTMKAISHRPGWKDGEVMTAVYTKIFTPSILKVHDTNGFSISGRFLTESDSVLAFVLTTTASRLSMMPLDMKTNIAMDSETLTIGNPFGSNESALFSGRFPFYIGPAVAGNNKVEAGLYDTLKLRWDNPSDANDSATVKITVRPSPKRARAYFSSQPSGTSQVDRFTGTESVFYLIVEDQVLPPGATAKATVVTRSGVSGTTPEKESFTLAAIPGRPGHLVATIPVDLAGVVTTNGRLHLSTGDQITGSYLDPVDTESPAVANAGFGIAAVIDAILQFTDKNFNVLPAGIHYSPAEGALYLQLRDDWVDGSIPSKQVTLTIQNNRGASQADAETFNITLVVAKRQGSTGFWEGSITLKGLPAITPNNNTAETYILGEVTARVTSHNGIGAVGDEVTDKLLVTYPDQEASIRVESGRGPMDRVSILDSTVRVVVRDQNFSAGKDTVPATLRCDQSGDVLLVKLVEQPETIGVYGSAAIQKSEGFAVADNKLQCKYRDFLTVTYVDPVYGTQTRETIQFEYPAIPTRFFFVKSLQDSTPIALVQERNTGSFYAMVTSSGPNPSTVDSVSVTFATPQGDLERFMAVETGPYTGIFAVKVPFLFVTERVIPGNERLEGVLTYNPTIANFRFEGTVTLNGTVVKSGITLVATPR